MSVVRKTVRRIDQKISIPWDSSRPADEQCKAAILDLVKGVPSMWGVMVSDSLLSFEKDELVTADFHGPEAFIVFRAKAAYEVLGYRPGDVLFSVTVSGTGELEKVPPRGQFKEITVIGLPFQLCVRTSLEVGSMNVMIDCPMLEGGLTYYAVPSYYPHYTPLVATLASPKIEEEPFYVGPAGPVKVSKDDLPFLDPLAELTTADRKKRIVADIKRMLSIGPGYKSVVIANVDACFGSSPTKSSTPACDVFIDFLELKSLKARAEALSKGKEPHNFIFVPSIPLFHEVVAAVVWFSPPVGRVNPTKGEVEVFERAVSQYLTIKRMEAESLSTIFKGGKEAVAAYKAEWLKAGKALFTKTQPVEGTKIAPPELPASSVLGEKAVTKASTRGRRKAKATSSR